VFDGRLRPSAMRRVDRIGDTRRRTFLPVFVDDSEFQRCSAQIDTEKAHKCGAGQRLEKTARSGLQRVNPLASVRRSKMNYTSHPIAIITTRGDWKCGSARHKSSFARQAVRKPIIQSQDAILKHSPHINTPRADIRQRALVIAFCNTYLGWHVQDVFDS
jgi:hypothetical protein